MLSGGIERDKLTFFFSDPCRHKRLAVIRMVNILFCKYFLSFHKYLIVGTEESREDEYGEDEYGEDEYVTPLYSINFSVPYYSREFAWPSLQSLAGISIVCISSPVLELRTEKEQSIINTLESFVQFFDSFCRKYIGIIICLSLSVSVLSNIRGISKYHDESSLLLSSQGKETLKDGLLTPSSVRFFSTAFAYMITHLYDRVYLEKVILVTLLSPT